MILPSTKLTPTQKVILEMGADRIIILKECYFSDSFRDIPKSICKSITRLKSLSVSATNYQACRKNFAMLLNQNVETLQEICVKEFDSNILTYVDPDCNFKEITKLTLETYKYKKSRSPQFYDHWSGIVSMINRCPNLDDLPNSKSIKV